MSVATITVLCIIIVALLALGSRIKSFALGVLAVVFGIVLLMLAVTFFSRSRSYHAIHHVSDSRAFRQSRNGNLQEFYDSIPRLEKVELDEFDGEGHVEETGSVDSQDVEVDAEVDVGGLPAERPGVLARPEWVDEPDRHVGDVHHTVLVSDPFATHGECIESLHDEMRTVTNRYLVQQFGRGADRATSIDIGTILSLICTKEWVEPIQREWGTTNRVHVKMEFDRNVRAELERNWKQSQLRKRLFTTGAFASLVLGALGIIYTYLKVDTATKGYYTKRLQFAAGTGLLGVLWTAVNCCRDILRF